MPMTEHLFIVTRQRPDLYGYLSREFSSEANVRVLVERRAGERRRQGERRGNLRGVRLQAVGRASSEAAAPIALLGDAFVRLPCLTGGLEGPPKRFVSAGGPRRVPPSPPFRSA